MRDRLIELLDEARAIEASGIECKVSNGYIADQLLSGGVIVLPCLREWKADGLLCGYELLYDDRGTFTVIHFGKSQKEDAIKIFEEIKKEAELAEREGKG